MSMAEKESDFSESQRLSVSTSVQRSKKPITGFSIERFAHELRSYFNASQQAVELIRVSSAVSIEDHQEYCDMALRNLRWAKESVTNAVDNKPYPLTNGEHVYRMFVEAFSHIVNLEDASCSQAIYEDGDGRIIVVGKKVPPGDLVQNTASPRVRLENMDAYIQTLIVRSDPIAIQQICKNAVDNAIRGGAMKIVIHFGHGNGTELPYVDVIISDNGRGIHLERLQLFQDGGKIETDKNPDDGITTKKDHGHGLSVIEEHAIRFDGTLLIESVHESMNPQQHGTDIIIRQRVQVSFPVIAEYAAQPQSVQDTVIDSSRETVTMPAEPVVQQGEPAPFTEETPVMQEISRKRFLQLVVGGITATAAGVGGVMYVGREREQRLNVAYAETPEQPTQHFIKDIEAKDGRIVSFTLRHPTLGELRYAEGMDNAVFSDQGRIDTPDASLVGIDVMPERGVHRMVMGAAGDVIFGFIAAPKDGANAFYLCITRAQDGTVSYREFPCRDTIDGPERYASNRNLIEQVNDDAFYASLQKLRIPAPADPRQRKWTACATAAINRVVKMREMPDAHMTVIANTLPAHVRQRVEK